jgi:hypothetical protein
MYGIHKVRQVCRIFTFFVQEEMQIERGTIIRIDYVIGYNSLIVINDIGE